MRNLELRRKMSLLVKNRQQKNPGGVDRREFLQAAALASSAVTMGAGHEPLQAGSASPAAPTTQGSLSDRPGSMPTPVGPVSQTAAGSLTTSPL